MFNLPRFGKFFRWLWHRSPLWYVFAPFLACIIMAAFVYFTIGAEDGSYADLVPHFGLNIVMPFTFMSMIFGALPIAIHFASRHLAKPEEGIAYLSLPVSTLERFAALFLGLFVLIPIWAYFNVIAFYLLLGLFRGIISYPFPGLADILPLVPLGILPYLAGAVLVMGITVLRPKNALVWFAGVAILLSILFPTFAMQATTYDFIVEMPVGTAIEPDNLVGRTAHSWNTSTGNYAMNDPWTFGIPAIVASLGFATVAFLGLRHKQV